MDLEELSNSINVKNYIRMLRKLKGSDKIVGSVSIAVMLSGVSSMGMQIVAQRVLTPHFGDSVYMWGSILTVFMVSLSLGYYIGGKKASSKDKSGLRAPLILSAAYIVLFIFLQEFILEWYVSSFNFGIYSYLPALSVLFGPPITLIGLISPYAAEASAKDSKGEASGQIYFAGTVGSIFGAIGTTFILLPNMYLYSIQLVFALFLVIGSWMVHRRKICIELLFFVAICSGLLILPQSGLYSSLEFGDRGLKNIDVDVKDSRDEKIIYETQTLYQDLKIRQVQDIRTMYLDGGPQSAMNVSQPSRYTWDYPRNFHLSAAINGDANNVLFIGGGGFSAPKRFEREYNSSIDVVEIDPGVVTAAKKYFRLNETQDLDIHIEDGRRFLRTKDNRYDIIIVDAYRGGKIPFHITTREFFRLVDQSLVEDGIVMTNIISKRKGDESRLYKSHYKTIESVFQDTYSIPNEEEGRQLIQVLASKENLSREKVMLEAYKGTGKSEMNMTETASKLENPDFIDSPVLYDGMGGRFIPEGVTNKRIK